MTTGVKTWSTKGKEVQQNTIPLIDKGDYTCILRKYEVRVKSGSPNSVPYVAVQAEVEGTALKEGGKNRNIFFNLLLSTLPGKDGIANVERSNGILAFSRALDSEFEGGLVERTVTIEGEEVQQSFLDPKEVQDWLKGLEGAQFRARIKVAKAQPPYGEKNEVDRFLPAHESHPE